MPSLYWNFLREGDFFAANKFSPVLRGEGCTGVLCDGAADEALAEGAEADVLGNSSRLISERLGALNLPVLSPGGVDELFFLSASRSRLMIIALWLRPLHLRGRSLQWAGYLNSP